MKDKTRLVLLKATLYVGAIYYLIGSFVHYFGLTLFPWFDGRLYAPYQDTLIALVAIILAYFLVVVAKDPIKNIDMLKAIIISAIAGSIFSITIIWKINFSSLGAPAKELQTIIEGILGFIFVLALLWLYPRKIK